MRSIHLVLATALISTGLKSETTRGRLGQTAPNQLNHNNLGNPRGNQFGTRTGRIGRATVSEPERYSSERESQKVEALINTLNMLEQMLGQKGNSPQAALAEIADKARWERDFTVVRKILTQTASLYCKSEKDSGAKQRAKEVLTTVSQNMGRAIADMIEENKYFYEREQREFRSIQPPPPQFRPYFEQNSQRKSDEDHAVRLYTKSNQLEIELLDSALWDAADVIAKECAGKKAAETVSSEKLKPVQAGNDEDAQLADLLERLLQASTDADRAKNGLGRVRRRHPGIQIDDLSRTLASQGRTMPPMMMGFKRKVTAQDALTQLPDSLVQLIQEK